MLIDDAMAASTPGSWPDALQEIQKPDPSESIQTGSKASDDGVSPGHGSEVDEVLPVKKRTAAQVAVLPPEILEQ